MIQECNNRMNHYTVPQAVYQWWILLRTAQSVKDMEALCGSVCSEERLEDGTIYHLAKEQIQVVCLDDQPGIFQIRVDGKYAGPGALPPTLASAKRLFAGLVLSETGDTEAVYTCSGLRLRCRLLGAQECLSAEFTLRRQGH